MTYERTNQMTLEEATGANNLTRRQLEDDVVHARRMIALAERRGHPIDEWEDRLHDALAELAEFQELAR